MAVAEPAASLCFDCARPHLRVAPTTLCLICIRRFAVMLREVEAAERIAFGLSASDSSRAQAAARMDEGMWPPGRRWPQWGVRECHTRIQCTAQSCTSAVCWQSMPHSVRWASCDFVLFAVNEAAAGGAMAPNMAADNVHAALLTAHRQAAEAVMCRERIIVIKSA